MKEHPILFSTEMVKAILEGRKTQTRRIIKPQPFLNKQYSSEEPTYKEWFSMNGSHNDSVEKWIQFCPHGKVGDQLWVRETWAEVMEEEDLMFVYKASNIEELNTGDEDDNGNIFKWRPSIFMPRKASRIQLEIVNIRVERLDNISEEDAKAEGVEGIDGKYLDYSNTKSKHYCLSAFSSYEELWIKINGKESWEKNPWVWIIEFKRIN